MLRFLQQWWVLLLVCPLVGGGVGYWAARRTPSIYEATVSVLVQTGSLTAGGSQDLQSAQPLADTFAEVVRTRAVLTEAAEQVGQRGADANELTGSVQARRVP